MEIQYLQQCIKSEVIYTGLFLYIAPQTDCKIILNQLQTILN